MPGKERRGGWEFAFLRACVCMCLHCGCLCACALVWVGESEDRGWFRWVAVNHCGTSGLSVPCAHCYAPRPQRFLRNSLSAAVCREGLESSFFTLTVFTSSDYGCHRGVIVSCNKTYFWQMNGAYLTRTRDSSCRVRVCGVQLHRRTDLKTCFD